MAQSVSVGSSQPASQLYSDIRSLQSINQLQREDSVAALNASAKQFESMLVQLMIKNMRDANAVFSEGNYLSGDRVTFYQQMLDDQWSVELTRGAGLGFAEQLVQQLRPTLSSAPPVSAGDADSQVQRIRQQYSVYSALSVGGNVSLQQ